MLVSPGILHGVRITMEIGLHLINVLYLVHELAGVEAEAVEEHLFAEDVHFLNSDEQGNHTGANDGAGPSTN